MNGYNYKYNEVKIEIKVGGEEAEEGEKEK